MGHLVGKVRGSGRFDAVESAAFAEREALLGRAEINHVVSDSSSLVFV